MRHFVVLRLTLSLSLAFALASCGGGSSASSSSSTVPATVDLTPNPMSLDFGAVTGVTVTIKNAAGTTINATTTFASSNETLVTVANSGAVCAGTWDSKTTPVVCTPATTAGIANITATAGGITSPVDPVTVHPHVTSVTLSAPAAACVSMGATAPANTLQFTAAAKDAQGNPVNVGAFTWFTTDPGVATVDVNGLATAVRPGTASVIAQVGQVNSLPITFVTCPPASITLNVQNSPGVTSFSYAPAATQGITVTTVDTLGNPITAISYTLNISSPTSTAVLTSATLLTTTAVVPGTAGISVSCTPPSCNPNSLNPGQAVPIYSNVVTATVTGTSANTIYVTGKEAHSVVPISQSTNTPGTAITVPQVTVNGTATNVKVNSMVAAPNGLRMYVGSDLALLILDTAANTFPSTVVGAPGKVLAVSPTNTQVVISDGSKVYLVDANTLAISAFIFPNVTAAAFSGDGFKFYFTVGNTLEVYSSYIGLRQIPLAAAANDVTALPQGSATYLAGGNPSAITARATCDNTQIATVGTAGTPLKIRATGDSTHVIAADNANIYDDAVGIVSSACPPNLTNALTTVAFPGGITVNDLVTSPDSGKALVFNSSPAVLVYKTAGNTLQSVTLTGAATTTTGAITLDSATGYVGATGSNDVHVVDLNLLTDTKQIAVGLKKADGTTVVAPDFIAIKK